MSKPELAAIYRMEFYKKQKNWKFGRDTKKKSSKPKKRVLLDQTYNVVDGEGVSPHNEAFLETGPNAPHASDQELEVAIFDIIHTSNRAEPNANVSQKHYTEPQKSPDINSNYSNINQNAEETMKPKLKTSKRLQALFEAVKNCSDCIEESNETANISCYRNNESPECDTVIYTNPVFTNEEVDDWTQKCVVGSNARQSCPETDTLWPLRYAPEAGLLAGSCPDEKQLQLQDLWIQLQGADGTDKPDGVQPEYPYQQPIDPQPFSQKRDHNPKNPEQFGNNPANPHTQLWTIPTNPQQVRNNPTNPQQMGYPPCSNNPKDAQQLGNNATYPQQLGNNPKNTQKMGYPPFPNNSKDAQQLGNNTLYPQRVRNNPRKPQQLENNLTYPQQLGNNPKGPQKVVYPPLPTNPKGAQQLGNITLYPQQVRNNPRYPQQLENYPTYPQQLGFKPPYPDDPQQLGNNPTYSQQLGNNPKKSQNMGYPPFPNNPKDAQQFGNNTLYPQQMWNNTTYPQQLGNNTTYPQQLGSNPTNPQQLGYNPPYLNNPKYSQQLGDNTIYPQEFNPPYPINPKDLQPMPNKAQPQPDENLLKNLLQKQLDLSLHLNKTSELVGVSYETGPNSDNIMTPEPSPEDVCGADGSDSWGSLDSADFMLGAHRAPHSSEIDLACASRDAPPLPLHAQSRDVTPGRGRGRLSARERQRAILWAARGRI